MTIQWADSFDRYGLSTAGRAAMLNGTPWVALGGNPIASPDPNWAGTCYLVGETESLSTFGADRMALPVPSDKVGVAFRVWMSFIGATANQNPIICRIATTTNVNIVSLGVMPNGALGFYTGDTAFPAAGRGTLVASSPTPLITADAWYHIEVFYTNSTGVIDVYINGILRFSHTLGSSANKVGIVGAKRKAAGSFDFVPLTYIRDFVTYDGLGSYNNSPLGTVSVTRIVPNEDIEAGSWLAQDGTTNLYPSIAKSVVNDALYAKTDDTTDDPFMVGFTNIDPDVTSIKALLVTGRMRKEDGGDAYVQMSISSNGSDWDDGADRPITTAYTYWFDVSEINPATSDPWTPIDMDNIVGKVNRTL